jgi:hypothetical protein
MNGVAINEAALTNISSVTQIWTKIIIDFANQSAILKPINRLVSRSHSQKGAVPRGTYSTLNVYTPALETLENHPVL